MRWFLSWRIGQLFDYSTFPLSCYVYPHFVNSPDLKRLLALASCGILNYRQESLGPDQTLSSSPLSPPASSKACFGLISVPLVLYYHKGRHVLFLDFLFSFSFSFPIFNEGNNEQVNYKSASYTFISRGRWEVSLYSMSCRIVDRKRGGFLCALVIGWRWEKASSKRPSV